MCSFSINPCIGFTPGFADSQVWQGPSGNNTQMIVSTLPPSILAENLWDYLHAQHVTMITTKDARALRKVMTQYRPQAVVLPLSTPWESGWLTAAKLRVDQQELPIVLVAPEVTPNMDRLAEFAGVTVVAETISLPQLAGLLGVPRQRSE